jgi:catechol 2,3-dioxygenase-like lactoylglutathione lyase family enzyme
MTFSIDHISYGVSDIDRALAFYSAALAPIGWTVVDEDVRPGQRSYAFGGADKVQRLWIGGPHPKGVHLHFAFGVKTRAEVDAFHAAALAAGGTEHGAPGERDYPIKPYYAAFVLDPDGNNIEVVCRV